MGISGLLPLLKDIQVTRPLSDFAGQTIAVDAYVWLHKGTYGCAAELATGRRTHKYVDYAMHRVRLLRHHRIQPYVVFDGGPLPAKQGTESERKKRRDENLARANAFAAQGKHTQAREYYVKCIDVTPQMAYQLIKALRAEGIPYVVAPYEADAQLAYLERIGVVDGVITEDSDLLVFGCRKVLLKLDVVESVVTCISRGDFGSAGAAGGMPLLGWSDAQFRRMAILSGCDYLASIPGVGLKTAWSLLRKHKTVENAVRMLMLEGKKKVPDGYLDAFKLAERVFLYQRVYDPRQKRLVHLTEPAEGERLDAETDAYVGSDIEPALAKQVAEGDACPISLLPMDDINATFVPRALKTIPLNVKDARMPGGGKATGSRQNVGKGTVGILSFFKPRAEGSSGQQTATSHAPGHSITAGRASGKRTLAEVMDHDIAVKRKKQEGAQREGPSREVRNSKFFDVRQSSFGGEDEDAIASEEPDYPVAGPSRITLDAGKDKENVPCADDDEVFMEDAGAVEQEDGYISPSPSMRRWDSPEVSSPLRVRSGAQLDVEEEEDFGADILSSPPVAARQTRFSMNMDAARATSVVSHDGGIVLVPNTPSKRERRRRGHHARNDGAGPDLQHILGECDWEWDDRTSDIECSGPLDPSPSSASTSSGPVTPSDIPSQGEADACAQALTEAEDTDEVTNSQNAAARHAKVAHGWWERWGRGARSPAVAPPQTPLKRRETTITPEGRHRPLQQRRPQSATNNSKHKGKQQNLHSAGRRRSLVFTETVKKTPRGGLLRGTSSRPDTANSEQGEDSAGASRNRFAEFRWAGVEDSVGPCRI